MLPTLAQIVSLVFNVDTAVPVRNEVLLDHEGVSCISQGLGDPFLLQVRVVNRQ